MSTFETCVLSQYRANIVISKIHEYFTLKKGIL